MGKILNVEEGSHVIKKYVLKKFDENTNDIIEHNEIEEDIIKPQKIENNNEIQQKEEVINQLNNDKSNEFLEELLKKSSELSEQIINLNQQLQNQSAQCSKQLEEVKQLAYNNGYNDGYNKAKEEDENEIKSRLQKLIESISKVEEVYKEYQSKAENIERELVGVAVDIAEQVIATEVSKNSQKIALNLTKELLNDIKEATKIEIKVNPLDYEYIKENLNLEKIKITPDDAISLGGVIILSDAGNIEAEIKDRFQTIKENILKD